MTALETVGIIALIILGFAIFYALVSLSAIIDEDTRRRERYLDFLICVVIAQKAAKEKEDGKRTDATRESG